MPERLKKLQEMPPRQLKPIALSLGLKPTKNWNREEYARRIRETEKIAELKTESNDTWVKEVSELQTSENSTFENLCDNVQDNPESEVDGRGGAREGAGRPEGVTAIIAKQQDALNIKRADPNIVFALMLAINAMYKIELKADEVEPLALPLTKLSKYYLPEDLMNSIWYAWIETSIAAYGLYKLIELKAKQTPKAE